MLTTDSSSFLRRSLLSNATFSLVTGFCFTMASSPISSMIGLVMPVILVGIGVSLLVFAAGLFLNARREIVNQTEAWIAVLLDTVWVVGSAVVIVAGVLSTTGNWIVVFVAEIVLAFAILQFLGLRKMKRAVTAR
jgi:hypothetical protein